jgi:preprotein translocase subunit SecD
MATNKDKGFLAGLASMAHILLFLLLVYGFIVWVIKGSIGEKVLFVIILFLFFLFYLWGTTLM